MYSANVGGYRPERNDLQVYTENKLGDPRLSSRLYKILSHIYDREEWSVYVDPDIFLPEGYDQKLIRELRESGQDIGVFQNPWRNCIYEEAEEVIRLKKADEKQVREQVERYRVMGTPEHGGLAACGVLVRHHTPSMIQLNAMWWAEYCAGSCRDQLSFPFIFKTYHVFHGNIYDFKRWS